MSKMNIVSRRILPPVDNRVADGTRTFHTVPDEQGGGHNRRRLRHLLLTLLLAGLCLPGLLTVSLVHAASTSCVTEWGNNAYDAVGGPTGGITVSVPSQVGTTCTYIAIAAASDSTLALDQNGTVWIWGATWDGQPSNHKGLLNSDLIGESVTPVPVHGLPPVVAIAASPAPFGDFLALDTTGHVWAWGSNALSPYLGVPATDACQVQVVFECTPVPAQVPNLSNIVSIAINDGASLALQSTFERMCVRGQCYEVPMRTVYAWGKNYAGQTGIGSASPEVASPTPIAGLPSTIVKIAMGWGHALALDWSGHVWAWGLDDEGQLGSGSVPGSTCPSSPWPSLSVPCSLTPVDVSAVSGVVSIAANGNDSMALEGNGHVWTWGDNSHSQLGDGVVCDAPCSSGTPVQAAGLGNVVAIAAGVTHDLALDATGQVWVWGQQEPDGGLGVANVPNPVNDGLPWPVRVPNLTGVNAIAAGLPQSVALYNT